MGSLMPTFLQTLDTNTPPPKEDSNSLRSLITVSFYTVSSSSCSNCPLKKGLTRIMRMLCIVVLNKRSFEPFMSVWMLSTSASPSSSSMFLYVRPHRPLCPRKPEGSLGRTAQDGHLDSHTAPAMMTMGKNEECLWAAGIGRPHQTKAAHRLSLTELTATSCR